MPHPLPTAGGGVLVRPIPATSHLDAMGPYPLLCCDDWTAVRHDIATLADEFDLVSVVAVIDPFCPLDDVALGRQFDVVRPFKDHHVADLSLPLDEIVSTSHRANVRRAARSVGVEPVDDPIQCLDSWVDLWQTLVGRHGIADLQAFSPAAFEQQLATPGMIVFESTIDGEVVGLDLWYVDGEVAYGHLVAFDERGYRERASYASKWAVLEHFADDANVGYVDLGGTPGDGDADDGLAHFKRGFANTTRRTHLAHTVLDPEAYASLTAARSERPSTYFPAYRADELT